MGQVPGELVAAAFAVFNPAVVEYHKNEKAMAGGRALTHIRASRDEFVKEIEANGFRAVEVKDFNPEVQWIGIFEPK